MVGAARTHYNSTVSESNPRVAIADTHSDVATLILAQGDLIRPRPAATVSKGRVR